jgi:hypothetical protein
MSFTLLGILNAQAAGGGGELAYDLLESETLSTGAASITFGSLNAYSDYKHLQIRMVARSSVASSNQNVGLTFNGDGGSNYSTHDMEGAGSGTVGSGSGSSITSIRAAQVVGTTVPDTWPAAIIDIYDFSNSSKNTTTRSLNGWAGSGLARMFFRSGSWQNTSAITTLTLTDGGGGFIAGSRFSLIGIR